jgi:hypothetical protein
MRHACTDTIHIAGKVWMLQSPSTKFLRMVDLALKINLLTVLISFALCKIDQTKHHGVLVWCLWLTCCLSWWLSKAFSLRAMLVYQTCVLCFVQLSSMILWALSNPSWKVDRASLTLIINLDRYQ